jgi:hypothetical protein
LKEDTFLKDLYAINLRKQKSPEFSSNFKPVKTVFKAIDPQGIIDQGNQ